MAKMRHNAHRPVTCVSIGTGHILVRDIRTLLSTTELLHLLLLVILLGVEGDGDAHTVVVLHRAPALLFIIDRVGATAIVPPLDDESALARGDQSLKDPGKLLGDLFECALNGLILDTVEMGHKFLNRGLRRVKLLPALQQLLLLRGEVVVLLKGLLVDMLELLQRLVDSLELL